MSLEAIGYEAESVVDSTDHGAKRRSPRRRGGAGSRQRRWRALSANCPLEQRDAFLLQIEGDLSIEEVATITHSSFETTKSRLRYARTRLRELLREYA